MWSWGARECGLLLVQLPSTSGSHLGLSLLLSSDAKAASPFLLFLWPLHSEVCGQNEDLPAHHDRGHLHGKPRGVCL